MAIFRTWGVPQKWSVLIGQFLLSLCGCHGQRVNVEFEIDPKNGVFEMKGSRPRSKEAAQDQRKPMTLGFLELEEFPLFMTSSVLFFCIFQLKKVSEKLQVTPTNYIFLEAVSKTLHRVKI